MKHLVAAQPASPTTSELMCLMPCCLSHPSLWDGSALERIQTSASSSELSKHQQPANCRLCA